MGRTQNQDYLIKPNTFSFIILLCLPDQVSGPLYIPILILILILLLLCFPDQVSGPPLLELHGVRSRSRELRRHLISRRHILPPKAEASGFFQRKKTFRNLKITPQVLRYMSENLSQLTGVVNGNNIDFWDSYFKFSGTSEFLRLDSGQLISLLNSNFPINMSESEVRLVPGSRCFNSYFPVC